MNPSTFFNITGLFLGLLLSSTCLTNLWEIRKHGLQPKPIWKQETAAVIKSYFYSGDSRTGQRTDIKLEDGTIAQVDAALGNTGDVVTVWKSGHTVRTLPPE